MPSTSIEGRAIRKTCGVVSCIGAMMLGRLPDTRPTPLSERDVSPGAGCSLPEEVNSAAVENNVEMLVQASDLSRRYGEGEAAVDALADVSVDFPGSRFAAIMGPSGSGKSTLMHILAGLDRPTSGTVVIDGVELGDLDDKKLTQLRRDKFGFIFQFFNLLPVLTAE